jgi:hypothetical protein
LLASEHLDDNQRRSIERLLPEEEEKMAAKQK